MRLFNTLKKGNTVYAPVEKEGYYIYSCVEDFSEIAIEFTLPLYPPKEFLLPQHEEILSFNMRGVRATLPNVKQVIFGVRPCDVNAINIMTQFMLSEPPDPYYQARREGTLIVAIQCTQQFENCFCAVFGTYKLSTGYDILLTPSNRGYYVTYGTRAGKRLLEKAGIKPDNKQPTVEFKPTRKQAKFHSKIQELDKYFNSKYWGVAAKDCFSCGGCTIVCPTCQCFDVDDHTNLDMKSGSRIRTWDSCQLKPFTRVAGNIFFRKNREERFRHRYFHKLSWGDNCVGCGRCLTICPTRIDMIEVVLKL